MQELIAQETKKVFPIRPVGNTKALGNDAAEATKARVRAARIRSKKWLEEEYPQIQMQAKQENDEIYWGDETGLRNDCQHERGYMPKGKTPTIKLNTNRESIKLISAITNQGKVRFRFFKGTMNSDVLIDFFVRLLKDAKRKVFMILDNLEVHYCTPVKE